MIYKYRNLTEYTREMIFNKTLYFSNPLKYNDPFDTIINFYFEGDYDLLCHKFMELGVRDYKGFAKKLCIRNEFTEIYKNNPDLLNLSITCFSEEWDNILLWAHYADEHKGICLEYKTVINDGYTCLLFDHEDMKIDYPVPLLKVNYIEKQLEKVNALFTKYLTDQLKSFLSTKYKIWEYEKEIRCIVPNSKFNNYPNAKLGKNVLNGIIFGLRFDKKEKEEFKKLVNSYHDNIVFYSAVQVANEYKLKIIKEQ
jgi:hypothetical protein